VRRADLFSVNVVLISLFGLGIGVVLFFVFSLLFFFDNRGSHRLDESLSGDAVAATVLVK